MKRFLASTGAILLACCSFIASPALGKDLPPGLPPNSTLSTDVWPPIRFQGDAGYTVAFVTPDLIDSLCGKAPPGWKTEACTTPTVMILPNPCSYPHTDAYAQLLCHEKAHVSGWPGTHGDAQTKLGE